MNSVRRIWERHRNVVIVGIVALWVVVIGLVYVGVNRPAGPRAVLQKMPATPIQVAGLPVT